MSALLWKAYFEDDFDRFQQLVEAVQVSGASHRNASATGPATAAGGSPGRSLGSGSPNLRTKGKATIRTASGKSKQQQGIVLTRADVNSKDAFGVTLLHMAASSTVESARLYAHVLLSNPLVDLYIQDSESGWTALHRALYAGNVSIARELMERDVRDFTSSGGSTHAGGLIKIKDHEGNSPFDVYALTITERIVPHENADVLIEAGSDNEDDDGDEGRGAIESKTELYAHQSTDGITNVDGEELFMFGSNKNMNLGFKDEDDRQFPERITLKRPDHVLHLLHTDHLKVHRRDPLAVKSTYIGTPSLVRFEPIRIQDVQLSKLHTAVLTTDPEANLYMCGFGAGGRLGTGDEGARFTFTSILGGGLETRKIVSIGLGQDHTLAVTSIGEVFSWGSDKYGQLGYALAPPEAKDDDRVQLSPRQLFGTLKRETVKGCAASRVHSAVYTSTSLFTFGKNDGQLGLVDSDARLLDQQTVPRKVAASLFSSGIQTVSVMDNATTCLLENHEVWVFANYGYRKVTFPLSNPSQFIRDSFSATNRQNGPNYIVKICCGGNTIAALARTGEIFNFTVTRKLDAAVENSSSTTNPNKIRDALSMPQRVWSLRKAHMAATDVDVGQDGSIILCTQSGSVWRRVKRANIKSTNSIPGVSEHKAKDYKFTRIPGLTEICAVRSNTFGAFSALRKDNSVLKSQINVSPSNLWNDMFPLLAFSGLSPRASRASKSSTMVMDEISNFSPAKVRQAVLTSTDIETDVSEFFERYGPSRSSDYDIKIGSTVSDIRIPCHRFMLVGRSIPLRNALSTFKTAYYAEIPDTLTIEYDKDGVATVVFQGLDILSLMNIVYYLYTDKIIDVWNMSRQAPQFGARYRQVRVEIMKAAAQLELRGLERAARLMTDPVAMLHTSFDLALSAPEFLGCGDIEVQLEDGTVQLHSAFICRRCPFFEGLFHGRAGGGWLASRQQGAEDDEDSLIQVDFEHVEKTAFLFVVRYLYGDVDEDLFADCLQVDFDDFLDLVLDVLSVANELMIDRLSQICQKVLGRYANTRNVCWLLNSVAACSVIEFKRAALEFICLNLEGMLENRLLHELDEDLVIELGEAVRANQLSCMPIGKGQHEEMRLFEEYPDLITQVEKERNRKVDYMKLQSHLLEDEAKMAKLARNLTPKTSGFTHDLMFDMDEDPSNPTSRKSERTALRGSESLIETHDRDLSSSYSGSQKDSGWFTLRERQLSTSGGSTVPGSSVEVNTPPSHTTPSMVTSQTPDNSKGGTSPWTTSSLRTSKLDMKEIMDQASETKKSSISAALASAPPQIAQIKSSPFAKLSQKERKRQLQAQKAAASGESPVSRASVLEAPEQIRPSPWRVPSADSTMPLQQEMARTDEPPAADKRRAAGSPSLTMRQTLPGNITVSKKATAEAEAFTRGHGSSSPINTRSSMNSQTHGTTPKAKPAPLSPSPAGPSSKTPLTPQSIRHILPTTRVEPSLQLSMADILAQQQVEKRVLREATAKRSLQEIQEEQAFQEWWDQEEAATKARMEQEAAAAAARASSNPARGRGQASSRSAGGRHRGRRGGRGGDGEENSHEGGRGGSSSARGRGPSHGGHRRGSSAKPLAGGDRKRT